MHTNKKDRMIILVKNYEKIKMNDKSLHQLKNEYNTCIKKNGNKS